MRMNSIVLIRFGALGDTLMLTPLFRYLARHFGTPIDYAGRGPWSRPLLEAHPDAGAVCELYSKRLPYALNRHQQAMVRWLRERREGLFIDLEADAKSSELLARAGVAEERIRRVEHSGVDSAYRHQVHASLACVRMCVEGRDRIEDLNTSLEIPVPAEWRADADAWLAARGWAEDELIVIAPGNKKTMSWRPYWRDSNRKHWPLARWSALCGRLLKRWPDSRILIVGAPAEQRLAWMIAWSAGHDRVHPVADDMPTTRMLALMARARGAITLDSGPAHAAAAVDCPVVTLFNATDPGRFRPLSASDRVAIVTPGTSLETTRDGIEVDRVFDAWCGVQRGPVPAAENFFAAAP